MAFTRSFILLRTSFTYFNRLDGSMLFFSFVTPDYKLPHTEPCPTLTYVSSCLKTEFLRAFHFIWLRILGHLKANFKAKN